MEDYITGIDEDLWHPMKDGPYHVGVVEVVGIAAQNESMNATRLKKETNEKMCIREMRRALPLVV